MKKLYYFALLLFCISCNKVKTSSEVNPPSAKFSLFEENLLRSNEPLLQSLSYDRVRVILHNPYNLPTYIFNVSKIGQIYTTEKKEVLPKGETAFTSNGLERRNTFSSNWNSIVKELERIEPTVPREGRTLYHGRTWIIELYVNGSYIYKEVLENEIPEEINSFLSLASFEFSQ